MSKITRILLVEDEPFISDIYAEAMELAGYTVEHATTGPEALKKTESFNPELILLDILIPELSGLEVAHILRTSPKYKAINTKIVMLTNLGVSQAGARANEEHVTEYLVKAHVTPNELVAHIRAIEQTPPQATTYIPPAEQL